MSSGLDLLAATTGRVAIIETQIALSRRTSFEHGPRRYHGKLYTEDTRRVGASIDNPTSFWPTKPSLVDHVHRRRIHFRHGMPGPGHPTPGGLS